jgi:hypothetical protein
MVMRSRFRKQKSDGLPKCGNINRDSGSGVRKNRLIKHDIMLDVNTPRGFIQTLIPFMHRTTAEEDTLLRPKRKFMSIILAKTRPTRTAKHAERLVVWMDAEEAMHRCVLLENRGRHAVNKITHGKESFIPAAQWQGGVIKESKVSFNEMMMLAFSNAVLLGGVRTGYTVRNARALKIVM